MTSTAITSTERRRRRATSRLLPKSGTSAMVPEPVRVHPRLAVYVRLSEERNTSVSIGRQRVTLEKYVAQLGGRYDPAADYFEDDDLSAKGTVYRPAAELLLERISEDAYDGVVVWEFARFMRNRRETHIACALLLEHTVELYSYEERDLTLYGSARGELDSAAQHAEREMLKNSSRVSAAREFMAGYGVAPSRLVFGMRKVPVPSPIPGRSATINRLVPDEVPRDELGGHSPAELVRQAAEKVLAGHSLRSLAIAWNRAGYRTSSDCEWSPTAISRVLCSPSLAGYTQSRGSLITDDDGTPLVFHTPLLTGEKWAELQDLLTGRRRNPRSSTDAPLRGLLRCGRCGAAMCRTGRTGSAYRCNRRRRGGQCEGNTIGAPKTEAFVIEAALALLADPDLLAQQRGSDTGRLEVERTEREQRIHTLRTALTALDRQQLLGEFEDADGPRRARSLRQEFVTELDGLLLAERTARRPRRTPVLPTGGLSVQDAYDAASPAERLTVLSELIEHVTVLPAAHRVNPEGAAPAFDHNRLVITWSLGAL
ncbi:hypothetical protein GALL_326070 [mine drainage metagenome]|uniref:Recombinase domain-containing protein n=1 Tax=mine drainage metagenome TaxID=410659 RepID=A0A1J5R0R4_9ZZZZ